MNKPDILLILTDQQSANMMSCAGNRFLHTPYMDKLAASGLRFERAYCTNPVCLPSRFSIFTGRYPGEIGVYHNNTPHNALNEEIFNNGLGFLLKNNGYDALYAGKQHLPFPAEKLGFNVITKDERDEMADVCAEYINNSSHPFFMAASFINPHDICSMAKHDFMTDEERANKPINSKIAYANVIDAMREVRDLSEDELLKYQSLPDNFEIQECEPEAISIICERENWQFRMEARRHYTKRDWLLHRYVYCKLTELVDSQISRIINALEESGQYKNTVIIFTSDHGDMDGAHRLEHKSFFMEECCRVPLIITPALNPGRIDNEHLISNGLDIIKTILDYAGIDKLSGLKGQSLRPLVEGKNGFKPGKFIKIESIAGNAVVSKNFKYAAYNTGKNNLQLYDRINDPGEMRNAFYDADKNLVLQEHIEALNQYKN